MAPPSRPSDGQKPKNNGDQPTSQQTLTHKPDDKTRLASVLQGTPASSDSKPAADLVPRTVLKPKPNSDDDMADFVRDVVNDFGPDRYAFFIYLGMVGVVLAAAIGFFLLSWAAIVTIIVLFTGFVVVS
ncbi:hypothetical protein C8A05DRAFT_20529, partial [Staphylotrichum tortipilum]